MSQPSDARPDSRAPSVWYCERQLSCIVRIEKDLNKRAGPGGFLDASKLGGESYDHGAIQVADRNAIKRGV